MDLRTASPTLIPSLTPVPAGTKSRAAQSAASAASLGPEPPSQRTTRSHRVPACSSHDFLGIGFPHAAGDQHILDLFQRCEEFLVPVAHELLYAFVCVTLLVSEVADERGQGFEFVEHVRELGLLSARTPL